MSHGRTFEGQNYEAGFSRGQRTESCMMCYMDLCKNASTFFFLKYNVKSLPGQY